MSAVVAEPAPAASPRRELCLTRPGNMVLRICDFTTDRRYLCASLHHPAGPVLADALMRVVAPMAQCHTDGSSQRAALCVGGAWFDLWCGEIDLISITFPELSRE